MDFTNYNYQVWLEMPKDIISEDYWARNQDLLEEITYDLFRLHENTNAYPPAMARVIIGTIFGKIRSFGLR